MTLHIFNPDNDMALAAFLPGFTPPANIRQMVDELFAFPRTWAQKEDVYAVFNTQSGQAFLYDPTSTTRRPINHYSELSTLIPEGDTLDIRPWGWSPALCHSLTKFGIPPQMLPDKEQLAAIRRLSSRQSAVDMLQAIVHDLGADHPLIGQSRMCHTTDEVIDAMSLWPHTILKAPWSSSGKGIRYGQRGREDTLAGWVQRTMRQQGGVVVEPLYNKVYDLAMEFHSDGNGTITYEGLSLFTTHDTGAYRGNLVASEQSKEEWLMRHIPRPTFEAVKSWLITHLATLIGRHYRGYLGVDMLLAANDESSTTEPSLMLHPLVEINLRTTMGMVSVLMARRGPTFEGELILEYAPSQPLPEDAILLAGGNHYRCLLLAKETPSRPIVL